MLCNLFLNLVLIFVVIFGFLSIVNGFFFEWFNMVYLYFFIIVDDVDRVLK